MNDFTLITPALNTLVEVAQRTALIVEVARTVGPERIQALQQSVTALQPYRNPNFSGSYNNAPSACLDAYSSALEPVRNATRDAMRKRGLETENNDLPLNGEVPIEQANTLARNNRLLKSILTTLTTSPQQQLSTQHSPPASTPGGATKLQHNTPDGP